MSSPIALGYADSVTLAAGQLLRVTGGGFITHGTPTRQSLFRGSSVFGPFNTEQVIFITASQSPVSYGTYSAEGAWLGSFASLAELQGAFPSPAIGDYATLIDGSDVPTIYRFGASGWAANAGGGGGGGDVASVNGKTGVVVLNKTDIGLPNAANLAPADYPVSDAQADAIAAAAASGPVASVAGKTGAVTLAVTDVSGAAPLASPTLTGTPTVPTAAADTNTTQAASTAFVLGQASSATPAANGTAAAGTSTRYARGDHVHPTDTTRAPLASPAFTGTPSLPTGTTGITQPAGDSTTKLSTTAFVGAAVTAERTAAATLTNKTLTAPTLSGTVAGTYTLGGTPTFPSSVVQLTSAQTLTNKTLTAPTITAPTFGGVSIASRSAMGANAIDVTAQNTKTVAANTTFTFTGSPTSGSSFTLDLTVSTACVVTWPTCTNLFTQAAQVATYLPVGRYKVIFWYEGTTYYIAGLPGPASNLTATTDPGTGDDTTKGYAAGSTWINTSSGHVFICATGTTGAAVWIDCTSAAGSVADGSVTLAKLANLSAKTYIGRTTNSTGVPEAVTAAQLKADLGIVAADAMPAINSKSAAYTLVLADAGSTIYHPAADTTARTWTIPANASVAFPVGTVITFDNDLGAGAITIAITTDTMVLVGSAGGTGSRTLAAGGRATVQKVTSTRWRISGGAELT